MGCDRTDSAICVALPVEGEATAASAQTKASIPDELRTSLQSRLTLFTQAQADDRWDLVASMLGRYRGGSGHDPYTQAHKDCLISQMQSFPMVSFTVTDYRFSTEILGAPADRRWWYLVGDAVYRMKSGDQQQHSEMVAYRDKGEWYFTPPNYDRSWERTHLTEADLSADYSEEIEIEPEATSPLEIFDLHVSLDKQYPSLRNLTLKLRNRSSKNVSAFDLRLYSDGGSVPYGAGCDMEPGSSREEKMSSARYSYFCEGVKKDKFVVDSVRFADGSEWERPKAKVSGTGHTPQ